MSRRKRGMILWNILSMVLVLAMAVGIYVFFPEWIPECLKGTPPYRAVASGNVISLEAESELPKSPLNQITPSEITAGLEKEADLIMSKIPKNAWFCVFTPEGKLLSSDALAEKIQGIKLSGKSSACFLIGSSFGIAPRIKEKADFKLSMSPMTFPHHLARIMVMEQLYRAESIQAGSKYHK